MFVRRTGDGPYHIHRTKGQDTLSNFRDREFRSFANVVILNSRNIKDTISDSYLTDNAVLLPSPRWFIGGIAGLSSSVCDGCHRISHNH